MDDATRQSGRIPWIDERHAAVFKSADVARYNAGAVGSCTDAIIRSIVEAGRAARRRAAKMATLTIRNFDDALKERLRVRAAEHGHSMEDGRTFFAVPNM
jgi:hypothetical protein